MTRTYSRTYDEKTKDLIGYLSNDGIFIERDVEGFGWNGREFGVTYKVEELKQIIGYYVFDNLKEAKQAIEKFLNKGE